MFHFIGALVAAYALSSQIWFFFCFVFSFFYLFSWGYQFTKIMECMRANMSRKKVTRDTFLCLTWLNSTKQCLTADRDLMFLVKLAIFAILVLLLAVGRWTWIFFFFFCTQMHTHAVLLSINIMAEIQYAHCFNFCFTQVFLCWKHATYNRFTTNTFVGTI